MDCNIIIPNYAKPKHSKPRIKEQMRFLIISLKEIKLKAQQSIKMKSKVTTMISILINQTFKIMILVVLLMNRLPLSII